jgi:NmrA-like family
MKKTILVAGATGNLGGKIVDALLKYDVNIKAIVRNETDGFKIKTLESKGVKVFKVDTNDINKVTEICIGAHCVVSALAGLEATIIDTQKVLLNAAVLAKVPRFIPSGFAIDYTNLKVGENRNLDFRREFDHIADKAKIQSTTIFNGPFMDLLATDMPLILAKKKWILCWGSPNQIMEFTTTLNVAEFTANVAIDTNTPRYMRIAGDRMTCNNFVKLMTEISGEKYTIFRPGGIWLLNIMIKMARFFSPGTTERYPAWQGMQYMRDMMEGRIVFQKYDNNRYPSIIWTSVKQFLMAQENKF